MTPPRQFDLGSGALPLDFANTVSGSRPASPRELLLDYDDLVAWGLQACLLAEADAAKLRAEAKRHPQAARRALERARDLREAIYRVFTARGAAGSPEASDIALIGAAAGEGFARSSLVERDGRYAWTWSGARDDLDRVRYAVARAASELLQEDDVPIVGECASDTCTWLFVDTSKNHSRRWCSMSDCGNRAKARRHYARTRTTN
ncbi:MAG: CGNR zinc finger domain-containing protein [Chloroflexi bacterium]|nr:CGNR zinc finger domain-containing protein [Chloroflexota bacterium]